MLSIAKLLIIVGLLFIMAGGFIYLGVKYNIPLGRLPGDFQFESGNITCFFALGTSLLLSIFLTIAINIIFRLLNK